MNTGNQKQNNGILILRIPPDGTFVRKEPILTDESAKDDYLIQVQLKQDRDKDGVYETAGKLFRFVIGQPTILEDEHGGEMLKLNLISVEYKTRETLDSERLSYVDSERTPFVTPKDAFQRRVLAYNLIKGLDNPALVNGVGDINLPDSESLKQEWRPFAPATTHDLFREIIERQSLPSVVGGVFIDHFFDYDPHPLVTSIINIKVEPVGTMDRGIVIDPLLVLIGGSTNSGVEQDKSINIDLINFKNNVILECSPRGGSLPTAKSRFASSDAHAKIRPKWDSTVTYTVNGINLIQIVDSLIGTRYFKALFENTNNDPLAPGQTAWYEDFVLVPIINDDAEYKKDQIITVVQGSFYKFFKAGTLIHKGEFVPLVDPEWIYLSGRDIPFNQRAEFFSYTPWTEDFRAMRASLFGVRSGSVTESALGTAGYSAVVPDINYVRANFDRVEANNRFEQRTFKDVTRFIHNPNETTVGERHLGSRFLINGVGTGLFIGHNNQIAEWIGEDFDSGNMTSTDWAFSDSPIDGDTIVDQNQANIWKFKFSSNAWVPLWDIITNPGNGITGNARTSSPLHICKNIRKIEGSSGIPGQAFELRYNWVPDQNIRNFNSIGAWFFMQFPFPKIETFGREIGDVYKNPVLDTSNMTLNSKGKNGWNNGIDSEDLGRVTALNFKARLSLWASDLTGLTEQLAVGYADMPMKAFAVDIFDRVWFTDFKLRRNGEYSKVQLGFGELGSQQLHHYRVDELLTLFGIILPFDFFLQQKEWTGIEFDWRFVKSFGIFYTAGYGVNTQYIASQFTDYAVSILAQVASQLAHHILSTVTFTAIPLESSIVQHADLAIDELYFEKQLYVNSDDASISNARTVLDHQTSEVDYLNAKTRAQGSRDRKKFVNQSWMMKAHGDVRMRFGEKFTVSGPRVPTGTQDLICNEVKHIIDSDGYMIEFTGIRKFVL